MEGDILIFLFFFFLSGGVSKILELSSPRTDIVILMYRGDERLNQVSNLIQENLVFHTANRVQGSDDKSLDPLLKPILKLESLVRLLKGVGKRQRQATTKIAPYI